jgi:hypothetical protein
MFPLAASDLLRVWELGQGRHPVDRALLFLALACPRKTHDELASLKIGQRDACLLGFYRHTFGATVNGFARCPQCIERLEFSVLVSDLLGTPPTDQDEQEHILKARDIEVRFRALNSRDLAAVANCDDAAVARRLLAQRCVLYAAVGEKMVTPAELPDEILSSLARCLADCDPQAELLFDLVCPGCGHQWMALFDIESFLWAEVCIQAKRLLHEVHILAQAYGWCESDILSMSTLRRRIYLEMVS